MRLGRWTPIIALGGAMTMACAYLPHSPVRVEPDPRTFPTGSSANLAEAGRKIADEHCASCHAIGRQTISPVHDAPPFGALMKEQDADAIANKLVAGLPVGHAGMRRFEFNVVAADALIAYLQQLQREGSPGQR